MLNQYVLGVLGILLVTLEKQLSVSIDTEGAYNFRNFRYHRVYSVYSKLAACF